MTEREWDKKLRISTMGREDETGSCDSPYEPTPYPVLARLADSGLISAGSRLLDYGCGKGRAVFFLADQVGCRATGIDRSEKLIGMAEENRRQFARGDRVSFRRCRAEAYEIRDEDVFFFFNPFAEKALRAVVRRIRQAWYEHPRPMRLLCYYPSDEYVACLLAQPDISPAGGIDCRDLFDGRNPRERIAVFTLDG